MTAELLHGCHLPGDSTLELLLYTNERLQFDARYCGGCERTVSDCCACAYSCVLLHCFECLELVCRWGNLLLMYTPKPESSLCACVLQGCGTCNTHVAVCIICAFGVTLATGYVLQQMRIAEFCESSCALLGPCFGLIEFKGLSQSGQVIACNLHARTPFACSAVRCK